MATIFGGSIWGTVAPCNAAFEAQCSIADLGGTVDPISVLPLSIDGDGMCSVESALAEHFRTEVLEDFKVRAPVPQGLRV